MTRITCCMPVHNAEAYLAEAIKSILAQTYTDFRLLIASDGSTDASVAIARALAERDPRVEVIDRTEKRGVIYTRNEMLERVDTEFMASMDADDVSVPDRFERQVNYLDAHPECVLVGGRVLLVDPEGAPLKPMGCPETHEEIDRQHIEGWHGAVVINPTIMARTDAVRKAGGYRESSAWAEDYDLFLRLAEVGRLHNLQDILLHYRRHLKSVGSQFQRIQRESIRALVVEARERRGLPPLAFETVQITDSSHWALYRQWALWAMKGNHLETARKYALRTVTRRPWSPRSWHTFVRVALRSVQPGKSGDDHSEPADRSDA